MFQSRIEEERGDARDDSDDEAQKTLASRVSTYVAHLNATHVLAAYERPRGASWYARALSW